MARYTLKTATVASASVLAMAVAGQAQAVEFTAGDTDVTLGGYTKLTGIYNVDQDLGDSAFFAGGLERDPDDNATEGSTRLHARQSRITLATSTDVEWGGPVNTFIQTDFYGAGNTLRLRHAYLEWNGVLAGQTWSNFQPLNFAPTIDFAGPAGYIFNRQGQLRYTAETGAGALSFSIEDPSASFDLGEDEDGDPLIVPGDNSDLPDLTARLSGNSGGFAYEVSGVLAQVEADNGNGLDDTTSAFGVNASGALSVADTKIGGQLGLYDGANRYLFQNTPGTYVDADGNAETVDEVGAMIYVDQAWTDTVSTALVYGLNDADVTEESAAANGGFQQSELQTVHANVRWTPVNNLMYGASVIWGDREFEDTAGNTDSEDAVQFQIAAQLSF